MKLKPYPKYKDSGIKWIGEIPEGWEAHRIKSFVPYIKNGQWGDDSSGGNKDFIVLRVADFLEFNFNLNKELTIRNIKDTKLRLKEGDLVIEKSGGGEKQIVGRVVQLKNSSKEKKYTYSNFIGKLEISNRMNNTFLNYYFKAFYNNRVTFNYIKQTTGIQNLDSESLIQREYFAYPIDKNYQKSIVSFLDKKIAEIDELIKKDKKLIELLKEKRTALINHAVTKGLDLNVKMKDSGIEWIGEIPEGWEVRRLRFNALVNPSGKKALSNPKTLVNFLPMEKVSENGEYNHESEVEYQNVSTGYTYFEDNDVLVAKITPCFENGKGTLVNNLKFGFGFGTTEFHIIRGYSHLLPRYLFYLTKTHFFRVTGEAFMKGTAGQKRVSADFVKDFMMVTPPKTEQLEIVRYLDKAVLKIDKTIQKIEQKIKLLEEYKKSLIHHIITGKIDIREVKI